MRFKTPGTSLVLFRSLLNAVSAANFWREICTAPQSSFRQLQWHTTIWCCNQTAALPMQDHVLSRVRAVVFRQTSCCVNRSYSKTAQGSIMNASSNSIALMIISTFTECTVISMQLVSLVTMEDFFRYIWYCTPSTSSHTIYHHAGTATCCSATWSAYIWLALPYIAFLICLGHQ